MDNKELMSKARMLLAQMIEIVDACESGQVIVAGEQITIDDQVKINMRQSFNAKRVDLIKTLNDVKLQ